MSNICICVIYGYIYTRFHESYEKYNACKLGETVNIPDRDTQYATGEIQRGHFDNVYAVPIEDRKIIEAQLQCEFKELHIRLNGGTEFYDKKIIPLIEPCLIKLGVSYKKLNQEEIDKLIRCHRIQKVTNKIKIKTLIASLKSKRTNRPVHVSLVNYIPRSDQETIIEQAVTHFQKQNKGILVLMCGMGKTLISLWVTQRLYSNTILIGVPNKLLLEQWQTVISNLFPNIPVLPVSGSVNSKQIADFLESNCRNCIVVTTYSSSHKVYNATKSLPLEFEFDMKILDEVHHLTTNNINEEERKTFVTILKINSIKQISLTATLKILENKENMRDDEVTVSNDNTEYFGEIIDRKTLLWAINQNIICDYVIQSFVAKEEQLEDQLNKFNITEDNDKRLFLSAFASLKSIYTRHSHHLLVYSNNKDNSMKIIKYINMLLSEQYFNIPGLFRSEYHSEMNTKHQIQIINDFKASQYGIITCVYCLGEGWDFPLLDGVVFAENMSSNIRIVQSALRASRKNKTEINKITKIILPILNKDDWLEDNGNPDLKKVKEVIYQMGLEDETITQKIQVSRINIHKYKPHTSIKVDTDVNDFGEYDDELTQRIRLNTVKRTVFGTSYEKAKKIIEDNNIKSKLSYHALCDIDNRLPKDPETHFKGKFTNWIEYLDIKRIYYDLEACKAKANEYLILYPEIKKHNCLDSTNIMTELCKLDACFPPPGLWVEYYNVNDLRDIVTITNKKKQKFGALL